MEPDSDDTDDLVAQAVDLLDDGARRYQLGQFLEALELWRQAQTLLSMPNLIDHAGLDALRANLLIKEGNALASIGRVKEALSAYARAQDLHTLPHLAARPELDRDRVRLAKNMGNG